MNWQPMARRKHGPAWQATWENIPRRPTTLLLHWGCKCCLVGCLVLTPKCADLSLGLISMSHLSPCMDRFGEMPGWEPQEPNGCIACGELDIDREGWCPRCNEEYGEKPMTFLTPCPFCHRNPVIEESDEVGFYIKCHCGARGPRGRYGEPQSKEQAIERWNNRGQQQREDLAPLA